MQSCLNTVGYMAAVLTTVAFVPQVWQTWRTKSAGDLHVWTLASFTLGVFLWTIYGVWAGAWPVILANGVTLLLQIPLLAMKVHYRKR